MALSQKARGELEESLGTLGELEDAERALAPWSGDHADAIFMLVALRIELRTSGPDEGSEAMGKLIVDLLEAVQGSGLRAESALNGSSYEVESAARQFLAGLKRN